VIFAKELELMGQLFRRLQSHRSLPFDRRWWQRVWSGILALSLVFGLILSMSGCSNNSTLTAVPTLVLSTLADPKTFNPVLSQEQNDVFGFIGQGLISENPVTGKIEPALAESWTFAPDKKGITFTLKPDLRWSDGKPLTVDDVIFTYQDIYLNEKIPSDGRDILRIGKTRQLPSIRKLDDRRIEFRIPEPFAPFLRITGIGILPEHVLGESVRTLDSKGNPKFLGMWGVSTPGAEIVQAGPYKIESYTTSQRVILRRNPYFWKKDAQGQPLPRIERIVLSVVESQDTELLQFRSGSLDVIPKVTSLYFSMLKQEEKKGDFQVLNGGSLPQLLFIGFNQNRGSRNGKPLVDPVKSRWFNSKEFRQAIAHAVDRQKMLINIYQGLGEFQNSMMIKQSPYYISPQEGLPVYNYDLDKAKQLLRQAGFTTNSGGQLLDPDGNPVVFTLNTNAENKVRTAVAAQVRQDLAKIGIKVDLQILSFNAVVEKLSATLNWDAVILGFGGGLEPNSSSNLWMPDGGSHMFNQKPRVGQPPLTGQVVADWERRIGDLYIAGAQELDEGKRKQLYGEAQKIGQEQVPFVYLINPLALAAVRNRVEGMQFNAIGGPFWNIEEQKLKN
jgi:peptide/nickel transport system substrate-binding protein